MNDTNSSSNDSVKRLHTYHPRQWEDFDYVYPVLSRRSKGLSIGVNLNPDKVCNWDCAYCQVDRTVPAKRKDVDLEQLGEELDKMLGFVSTGAIWTAAPFEDVPEHLKRVNDIAFSGDGEPTTYGRFDEVCELAVRLKAKYGLDDTKVITLTNMTMLHREQVQRGFELLAENNSEIWAKLDAGTEAYYKLVDRSKVKFERVLENILKLSRSEEGEASHRVVIQSLFMKVHGEPVPAAEFEAYLDRLEEISAEGGAIAMVQLYTIARDTAEDYVAPLSDEQLDGLAARFRERLPEIACETFYGG